VNRAVKYLNVACEEVDLKAKKVLCSGASDPNMKLALDYDHLVVGIGAQPNTFGIKGVMEHAMFLKEVEHGRAVRKKLLNNIERAEVSLAMGDIEMTKKLLHVVVVGGGPTGVEFCGELTDFINCDLKKQYPNLAEHFKLTIVEGLPCLLSMFKKEVQDHVKEHLEQQGVEVRLGCFLKEAEADKVHTQTKDGLKQTIDYGMLLWVGGVCRRPFTENLCSQIGKEGGQTDRRGIVVDECLRVKGTPPGEVFAIGDCAFSGKPPTAQVAMQQGKYLGRMFRRDCESALSAADTEPFNFRDKGKMAYVGNSTAVTEVQPANVLRLGKDKMSDYVFWKSLYGQEDDVKIVGWTGFAVWRYTYVSTMFSYRNQFNVGSDWIRAWLFGRPAASSSQGTVGN
jgi:NADH:ubiquinone reductase (non-electrogenic)